ncbi:MAG TPA: hypothetical protein VF992_10915 [Thermoplasmata archaeon]
MAKSNMLSRVRKKVVTTRTKVALALGRALVKRRFRSARRKLWTRIRHALPRH